MPKPEQNPIWKPKPLNLKENCYATNVKLPCFLMLRDSTNLKVISFYVYFRFMIRIRSSNQTNSIFPSFLLIYLFTFGLRFRIKWIQNEQHLVFFRFVVRISNFELNECRIAEFSPLELHINEFLKVYFICRISSCTNFWGCSVQI